MPALIRSIGEGSEPCTRRSSSGGWCHLDLENPLYRALVIALFALPGEWGEFAGLYFLPCNRVGVFIEFGIKCAVLDWVRRAYVKAISFVMRLCYV